MIDIPVNSWSDYKALISNKHLQIQYRESSDKYELFSIEQKLLVWSIVLLKDGGADVTDWESNYKSSANAPIGVTEISGVKDPKGMRARLIGIFDNTITKNTTQDLDWQIPDIQWLGASKQSYFDGIKYKAINSEDGDTVTFQVVDKDGIVYPAGTVLEEFGTNFPIFQNESEELRLYKAKLIPNMYIRIKYTSTGTTNDVRFIAGLYRHLDANVDL